MMIRKLLKTDREAEKRILIGIIVSDLVLNKLHPLIQPDIFELDVSKKVVKWILEYYERYKAAPRKHIKDIFEVEKKNIKQEGLGDEIALFLSKLSSEYLSEDESSINEEFIIDHGKKYLKERYLRKIASDMMTLLDIGRIDEAEELYNTKKKIVEEATYDWVAPFDDPKYINSVFDELEMPLFRLKGKMGDLFGDFYRGWLMAIMGPMKRGKTWGLQDIAFDALLSRKRVAYFSFEMKDRHWSPRMYKQLGTFGDTEREYIYPCFDCCYNQDNSCNKKIRTNKAYCPAVFDPKKPTEYMPCTACRGNRIEEKDFLPTVWYFVVERPGLSRKNVKDKLRSFRNTFGRNRLRVRSFPAYSASMTDVENELDKLMEVEGFIPDVIITDYATIMAPTAKYNDPRHHIDEVFKQHKKMAGERSAFVVTGAQSLGLGRAALNKDMQDESDIAGNAMILANVDILSVLDQTVEEKEKGMWRIGILEHRWRLFNKRRQVLALQQLELGQPILDAEIIYWNSKTKNED